MITETAVFGGGCFWCTEAVFKSLKGVVSAMPGYSNGVEVAKIIFNPQEISYDDLLAVFFNVHDPTTLNRQGNDIGEQYRSVIFYTDDRQKEKAEKLIKELDESGEKRIVTAAEKFEKFDEAEDYHKNYYQKHKDAPYCQLVIAPKMDKFREKFEKLISPPNPLPARPAGGLP